MSAFFVCTWYVAMLFLCAYEHVHMYMSMKAKIFLRGVSLKQKEGEECELFPLGRRAMCFVLFCLCEYEHLSERCTNYYLPANNHAHTRIFIFLFACVHMVMHILTFIFFGVFC